MADGFATATFLNTKQAGPHLVCFHFRIVVSTEDLFLCSEVDGFSCPCWNQFRIMIPYGRTAELLKSSSFDVETLEEIKSFDGMVYLGETKVICGMVCKIYQVFEK